RVLPSGSDRRAGNPTKVSFTLLKRTFSPAISTTRTILKFRAPETASTLRRKATEYGLTWSGTGTREQSELDATVQRRAHISTTCCKRVGLVSITYPLAAGGTDLR